MCPFCLASSMAEELENKQEVTPVLGADSYEQIGPYRVLDRLGEGAYGIVYRAEQERPLHRFVAIKILKAVAVNEHSVARFEAERQALAMMEHPAIAHVYDVGETEEGLPYFVMELIEGDPISTSCQQRELNRDDRLKLFMEVCQGIAHAHRQGIIHRDLKPSNVLVSIEGEPKIIDFGIAKATENILTERTLVTRDHQVLGTPAYMSPEQARMQGGDVDTRADIYSLGVLLYELLTGTTPFRVEELARLPYDEALRRVRTEDPQRPSSRCRDLTRTSGATTQTAVLSTSVSIDLDWIVMKALEKEPDRRYETAGALARDIERFLSGEAIEARPPTPGYLLSKFVRRHRIPVLATAAVLVAMIAGTIVSLVMFFRAEENAALAEKNEILAEAEAGKAQESEEDGRRLFSRADFNLADPLLVSRRPGLAVAHLARALRTDPTNQPAASRLLTTLAMENWAEPRYSFPLRHGPALFSPDGRFLMGVGQYAGKWDIVVRSATTGEKLRILRPPSPALSLAYHPTRSCVALGSTSGEISFWHLESGRRLAFTPESHPKARRGGITVQFSPDGNLISASFWRGRDVFVWELDSGRLVAHLEAGDERSPVAHGIAAFSQDSQRIAVGLGTTFEVFDLTTGKAIAGPFEQAKAIQGVRYIAGGERLVSWSEDGFAVVWDETSAEAIHRLPHEAQIISGAVSPDGSRLLTGTGRASGERSESFSRLWDLESGELIGRPLAHPSDVRACAFSPDGLRAATGCLVHLAGEGAIRVLDGWTGEHLTAPIYHPRGVGELSFNHNGTLLVASSRNLDSSVWHLPHRRMHPLRLQHRHWRTGQIQPIWRAVFDPDAPNDLLSISWGGSVRKWDATTGKLRRGPITSGPLAVRAYRASGRDSLHEGFQSRRLIGAHAHTHYQLGISLFQRSLPNWLPVTSILCAAATQDGTLLYTGSNNGTVVSWNLATKKERQSFKHDSPVSAIVLSDSGELLITGTSEGVIRLWRTSDGELLGKLNQHEVEVTALAISSDDNLIASGTIDGEARFWWRDRKAGGPPMDHVKRINHFAFSPDGTMLAGSGSDNTVRLWDTTTGEQRGPTLRHIDTATYGLFLIWSDDGKTLISTGSHDNTARTWNIETGRLATKPMEQPSAIYSLALRPDGKAVLLSGDLDFQSRIWDLASGEPLTPFLRHDGRLDSSAWNHDGSKIAIGTRQGSVFLWDVPVLDGPLPPRFLDYAETLGGFRFNAQGVLEPIPSDHFAAAQSEIIKHAANREGILAAWMSWLSSPADGATSVSPRSNLSRSAYQQRLSQRRPTITSLLLAAHMDPNNPALLGALGHHLTTKNAPSRRDLRFGLFLLDRAIAADPGKAEIKWISARVRAHSMLESETEK